ncbi:hypothetical protein RvY_10085-1 [Ramazzottius varieornatus]|uniref:L-fucokinase domain-containing protein n=1 Tax=Ramazzottius varieornatus TaxID=947166 RepID=A0A1D1VBL4_RAMVA|nr:hypothetical protein RvY_10085-1 [Ramazzottius varieornatus]
MSSTENMSSTVNFMRDLLDRYQKLRDSTALTLKGTKDAFWDIVVLTACDAEQGRAFQIQIDLKKKHHEVPSAYYVVVVDKGPFPRCKIGAGGSTFLVLEELHRRFLETDLKTKKVLLIHAGGWSQRLPSASVLGKLFMPLPVGFGGDWDMLDLKLSMYLPFIPLMQPGIFVTASDDLELFVLDSPPPAHLTSASGFVALGHPSSLHIGTTHGVFVCERSVTNQEPAFLSCSKVFQKPSIEEMKEGGAVLDVSSEPGGEDSARSEPCVISDSAYWMDMNVAEKLFGFYRKYGVPEVEVDCYGDFMRPLGKDADEKYIEKTKDQKMRSVRRALFDTLHDVPIQVLFLPQSRFIHLGTMREYLDALVDDRQLQASLGINTTTMHSIVNEKSSISPQSVLEYCCFLQPLQVEAYCLLSNCSNESGGSWTTDEKLIVPCGTLMHTVVVSVNGQRLFVTVFCGIADDIKAEVPRNNVALLRIFGSAFSSFLTDFDEVLPSEHKGNVSLWTVRFFPVCKYPGQSFLESLRIVHSITKGKMIERTRENFPLMSFADALCHKDTDGSLEYRERLRCRVISTQAAALNIVTAGIEAVKPEALIKKHVVVDSDSTVRIYDFSGEEKFAQKVNGNVCLLGAGKAALGMFESVYGVLKDHVKDGLLIIPTEAAAQAENSDRLAHLKECNVLVLFAGRNNLPNEDSIRSSKAAIEFVSKVQHPVILLCVISGGASALLCAPVPPVTLQEKLWMTKTLASRGAPIQDLNVVRGRLSQIKGGHLAQHISSEVMWASLILSDIIGDPLELIGGGPTVPGNSRNLDAVEIVKAYGVWDSAPENVREVLSRDDSAPSTLPSTLGNNILVGNNTLALNVCKRTAIQLGYQAVILTNRLQGNCRDAAKDFALIVKNVAAYRSGLTTEQPSFSYFPSDGILSPVIDWNLPVCIVAGGETTVTVTGHGKGGRNQEMALAFAMELYGLSGELSESLKNLRGSFASCGTDGQDNTDAAGAQINFPFSSARAEDFGHANKSLGNNDSYAFFSTCRSLGSLLFTGLTGTNAMDLQVLLIS